MLMLLYRSAVENICKHINTKTFWLINLGRYKNLQFEKTRNIVSSEFSQLPCTVDAPWVCCAAVTLQKLRPAGGCAAGER